MKSKKIFYKYYFNHPCFGVITEMADKVMVMYAGHKIEEGKLKDIVGDQNIHIQLDFLIQCQK